MLKLIDGGVCAAQGFKAAGIHVGVKTHADWKKDVALIVSDVDCAAAAMFTAMTADNARNKPFNFILLVLSDFPLTVSSYHDNRSLHPSRTHTAERGE